jgi:hypothetical protein
VALIIAILPPSYVPPVNAASVGVRGLPSGATGEILYYTGSVWDGLAPGTAGYVLTTNGTSQLPYWSSAGTVNSTTVAAAGAVMEADTSTASMSFVIDEDTMVSDLATKVPTQQSVKSYATNNHGTPTSLTNLSYSAASELVTCTANGTLARSQCIYIASNSTVAYADASANATAHPMGLTVSTGAASGSVTVLLRGFYCDTAWNWAPGDRLYLSTTTGNVTNTAPSSSGEFVVSVGRAYTADVGYFFFDDTDIELE